MALLDLFASPGTRNYSYQVELEGRVYTFAFRWNLRASAWFFDLYGEDGTPIALGRRVVADWPWLRHLVRSDAPPGTLIALDSARQGDPGLEDLGARVSLVYRESEGA